jgi:phospholipid/cholesterol/gamma-HCH transport system substrate-binding protein
MNHNAIETVLGAIVLLVTGTFLVFAMGAADLKKVTGYDVTANFSKIDGISTGMDVRISGVKIGSVAKTELDPQTYLAKVTLSIDPKIKLPSDTVAKVSSESLLGGKYMSLEPGAEEDIIKPGGQIQYTQASVNLEEMIGKFIFGGKKEEGTAPVAAPAGEKKSGDGFSSDY